jgi:hypothetical protein
LNLGDLNSPEFHHYSRALALENHAVQLENMQTETLVALAVAVCLFTLYTLVLRPAFFSPLARIPTAHWSSSVSSYWILRARKYGKENRSLFDAHLRHGPVVRVAPNTLSVDGVDAMRAIYQGGYDKPDWYKTFDNYG